MEQENNKLPTDFEVCPFEALVRLSWVTDRRKSGTLWRLFDGSQPANVNIFKSHMGYVLNRDEYPIFKTLKKAKNEGTRRYKNNEQ